MLDRLQGEQRLYLSVDRVMCDDEEEQQNYPLEFIKFNTFRYARTSAVSKKLDQLSCFYEILMCIVDYVMELD